MNLDHFSHAGKLVAIWALSSLVLMYLTFVHFAAVMRIRELRDSGKISPRGTPLLWWTGMMVLAIGLTLDFLLNVWTASVVMLEFPREWLTSNRLDRWLHSSQTDWWTRVVRKRFVLMGQMLLDPVDTDGVHIQ